MKNKLQRFLFFILFLCGTLLLSSCAINSKSSINAKQEQDAFDLYLDDLFRYLAASDTLSLNYTLSTPSDYQIHLDSPTLGNFTTEAMQHSLEVEQNYLLKLLDYQYDLLTKEQQLTYDIIQNNFELDVKNQDLSLYSEVLGPTTGLQAQLPILLAEYNFYSKEDICNYLALLVDTKRYFGQICSFEQKKSAAGLFMSDQVASNIIAQCKSFISDVDHFYLIDYFDEKLEEFPGLTESEKAAYREINEGNIKDYVIPAYKQLIDTLEDLKGSGQNDQGLYYYENGKQYYEYLVAAKTGCYHSIGDIALMIDHALNASLQNMSQTVLNDPDILDKINNYNYVETKPERILTYLKSAIAKDFPSLPVVNCTIKYVHPSLQDYLSPAMYLIPPLDNYQENIIYINRNPKYDMSEIFTTIAHEGYPGHLYQCVYFRAGNHHPIRNVFGCLGYDEGWATYAETYSYDIAGLEESVASILKDNMIATHCIYSRTDIGIHYEGWTYPQVRNYLTQFVNEAACKEIYETLLEEPAIYLPYCIGYLEITNLRDQAMAKLGQKFDLKEFHKFLLDLGPADFDIIESRFREWLVEQK